MSCRSGSITANLSESDTSNGRGVKGHDSADIDRWVSQLTSELLTEDLAMPDGKAFAVGLGPSVEVTDCPRDLVNLDVEYGRTRIAAEQLGHLDEVISLDQAADEPLDIVADGRAIARGELVVVQGRVGVRIVELLSCWLVVMTLFATASFGPESFAEEQGSVAERPRQTARPVRIGDLGEPPIRSKALPEKDAEDSWSPNRPEDFVRLSPPSSERLASSKLGDSDASRSRIATNGWNTSIWLIVILAGLLVAGFRWFKTKSPASRSLPNEAFEILGRRMVDQRTSVLLARCGSRLLLLSLAPTGMQTLVEITDPVEIDCLSGLCHASQRDQRLTEIWRSLLSGPTAKQGTSQSEAVASRTAVASEVRWSEPRMPAVQLPSEVEARA